MPDPSNKSPSPKPLQIEGNVVDSRTGEPLPTATIYVNGSAEPASQSGSTITDKRGYFQLKRLNFPLTIRVEAPGYKLWENTFDASKNLVIDGSLALEINLVPQLTPGVVRASDTGEPLEGVEVRVTSQGLPQGVTTDAAGEFELYSLLPQDQISVPTVQGFLPLEIRFGGERELTLSLTPRQMTVFVHDSFTGYPVVGGQLAFSQAHTATTNTAGEAFFTALPPSGKILAGAPGYRTVAVDYEGEGNLDIGLTPSEIQGVVRGADTGRPLPLAKIYVGDTLFQADENGHFKLESWPVSPTPLMIKAAGYHRTHARLDQTGVFTNYDPPFSGAEGRWLVAATCRQAPEPDGPPCLDFSLDPFQAKAIYIPLRYLHSRERMLGYLDFIAATELNAIVIDVKGDFGFITWDSEVALVSEVGADDWFTDTWLPLDEFIAEAKARNIYTIARLVVFKDNPLAHGKPEWATVTENGTVWIDREELGWANPFREEVWDYNIELAKEVAAFGFDELNFDYIRFPSDGDVRAIVYEQENTLESRTTAIRQFMTRLSEALEPYGVFVSADVFGLTLWVRPDSDMRIGQRLIDVAPQIDYLAPMVYPSTFIPGNLGYADPSAEPYGIVYRSQKEAEKLVPRQVKVRPWLQGYWYSLEGMGLLKQAAIDAESAGWSWWNAGGNYEPDLFEPAKETK
jgi:hypothetical protein